MLNFGTTPAASATRLEEAEVLEHRVVGGEADRSVDVQAERTGLHALELDAVVELDDVDAVQHPEEVEVPPRAAELAVGGDLEARRGLAGDERGDRVVFDGAQFRGVDLAGGMAGARGLDRFGTQEAADDVGAERRVHGHTHNHSDLRSAGPGERREVTARAGGVEAAGDSGPQRRRCDRRRAIRPDALTRRYEPIDSRYSIDRTDEVTSGRNRPPGVADGCPVGRYAARMAALISCAARVSSSTWRQRRGVVVRDHDADRGDHVVVRAVDGNRDAARLLVDVTVADRPAVGAHAAQRGVQLGLGLDRVRRVAAQRRGEDGIHHGLPRVREQHEAARGGVQRDAPADERRVHDGVARREPIEEQHLGVAQHAELRVLAHARVHGLQVRSREFAQSQRAGGAARELPQPHAEPVGAVGQALEESLALELADDAVRGRRRESGALGDLGQREERDGGLERAEHAQVLVQDGFAVGCACHGSPRRAGPAGGRPRHRRRGSVERKGARVPEARDRTVQGLRITR